MIQILLLVAVAFLPSDLWARQGHDLGVGRYKLSPTSSDSLRLFHLANSYHTVDERKAVDTMRYYVETHPFATTAPGKTLDAIRLTNSFVGFLQGDRESNWIEQFNWLARIQPMNSELAYQKVVGTSLADAATNFDLHLASDLLNYLLLTYRDSESNTMYWNALLRVRQMQKDRLEDTLAFRDISLPLSPYVKASISTAFTRFTNVVASPNPFTETTNIYFIDEPIKGPIEVFIYSIDGRLLYQTYAMLIGQNQPYVELNLKDLPEGAFLFHVKGSVQTAKGAIRKQQ